MTVALAQVYFCLHSGVLDSAPNTAKRKAPVHTQNENPKRETPKRKGKDSIPVAKGPGKGDRQKARGDRTNGQNQPKSGYLKG